MSPQSSGNLGASAALSARESAPTGAECLSVSASARRLLPSPSLDSEEDQGKKRSFSAGADSDLPKVRQFQLERHSLLSAAFATFLGGASERVRR